MATRKLSMGLYLEKPLHLLHRGKTLGFLRLSV